jgi:isoleucyl-tRNA synthetase
VVQALQNFCSEDLGAFYLDILKDRLYTAAADSKARRSAQNALHHILQALTRLMAPVLSFTAEEIWQVLNGNGQGRSPSPPAPLPQAGEGSVEGRFGGHDRLDSVMLTTWHDLPADPHEEVLMRRWAVIREVRAESQKVLEDLRTAGKIGSSLAAEVVIHAGGEKYDALVALGDDLRFVLISSSASVKALAEGEMERIEAKASEHQKCERCWHYREDVASNAEHPELCGRCVSNLFGAGEPRRHA